MFRRTTLISAAVTLGMLTAGVAPDASAAKPKRPDLTVAGVSLGATVVAPGGAVTITHTVKNAGTKAAKRSSTRFYLSTNVAASLADRKRSRANPRTSASDLRLTGTAGVGAVKPRRTTSVRGVRVTVPASTQPGTYWVLACADDLGRVAEKKEDNNCKATGQKLTVRKPSVPNTETPELQTFADAFRWPDSEAQTLQNVKVFCQSNRPVQAMTLTGAIASVRTSLTQRAGADALTRLNSSGMASSADQAQELAAAALAKGSPGLAMAALLKAHELEPNSAGHLINAASLANTIGLPNEAIAFLDAAKTRSLLRPAMGIDQRVIADVVRGNALVLTGRPALAKPLFASAKQAEPLLSEADAGLATVEACQGEDAKAMRLLRKQRQRSEDPDNGSEDRPTPAVDTSTGQSTPLRQLPMAETPAQGVKMYAVYRQIHQSFTAAIDASNAEDDLLSQRLRDGDQFRTRAEKRRRDGILNLVYNAHKESDIQALDDTAHELWLKLNKIQDEFFGSGTGEVSYEYQRLSDAASEYCAPPQMPSNCFDVEMNRTCRPALIGAHSEWRAVMGQYQTALNTYFEVWSKRKSGYAANLADPDAYRLATLSIEDVERGVYASLVAQADGWTNHERLHANHCVEPLPAQTPEGPAAPGASSPGPCTDQIKAFDIVMSIGPVTVKVNCEKVQLGITTEEVLPLLTAFAEVTYDFRAGKVTIFSGAAFGTKLGDVLEGSFKSGVYLTTDKDGIADAGWRVGPSVAAGVGSVESGLINHEIDLSFIAGLKGTD